MRCPSCNAAVAVDQRFCGSCGTALGIGGRTTPSPSFAEKIRRAKATIEGERKQVTVLFVDVKGSMQLAEQLVSSRIDRLPDREKQVLQTAAVIGTTFDRALLGKVAERVAAIDESALGAALSALSAGEFLYEAALYPDREYAFQHPLTQEVADRRAASTEKTTRRGRGTPPGRS